MTHNGIPQIEVLTFADARVSGPPQGSVADIKRACTAFLERTQGPQKSMKEHIWMHAKKRRKRK